MTDKVEVVKKLTIWQKLQKARVMLQERDIKASGKNTFSNYTYIELKDFLPYINEICDAVGLAYEFRFGRTIASLTIIDSETGEKIEPYTTPVEIPNLKGCSAMQNIGGAMTFSQRYLYGSTFGVCENDIVNNGVDPDEIMRNQKISAAKKVIIRNLIEKTETNTEKYLEVVGFKTIEDITEGAFVECKKLLEDKKAKLENKKEPKKEYEAVFN